MNDLPSRDLVLIGAGHTNLHVVRMWRMRPIPDVRLTVISPFSRATYSGMLPGTLAGLYGPGEMEIDLWRFAESAGARLVVEPVVGFDPDVRRVLFADRPPLRYDVASIGIGSVPGQREVWNGNPRVLSIKPMATFCGRLEAVVGSLATGNSGCSASESAATMPRDPPRPPLAKGGSVRVVVVGAGAGGTEVAFGLDGWLRARGITPGIALIDANAEILDGYSAGTVARARREMARRGIEVHTGKRVAGVGSEELGARNSERTVSAENRSALRNPGSALVTFDDGTTLPADIVIWATAAAPPPVLGNFRLPKTADGFLAVRSNLLTTADYPVFAVGDTASFAEAPLPKAGVYAVREGPVLWENIQRLLAGRDLIPYEPQRGFLSLLSTGDERAIMEYKGFSGHGRWAWKWKDYIDRKFMRMYQDYRPQMRVPQPVQARGPRRVDPPAQIPSLAAAMRCSGCGSKVGSRILAAALERLDLPPDNRTTIGLARPDDATVLDRAAAPVDVLSVDFFPAFLDDPYLVGRIAALNALSDLWAMGSDPLGAMAIVTLPEGSPTQQTELLYQLLAGGLRELRACGASLWGGHTTEGPELTIGYTVAGRLDGRTPFAKGNLRPGDRLLLTKPLGAATLLAAHRECLCRAEWMDALVATMLDSNATPARLAREAGVQAATDVTGFGLAGHLLEMLDAGGVSARLELAAIPLLDGFAELSGRGVRSSLDPANRSAEARLKSPRDEIRQRAEFHALFDPQTSGGMLIAVPPDCADEFVARLRNHGSPRTAIVGEVMPRKTASEIELVG